MSSEFWNNHEKVYKNKKASSSKDEKNPEKNFWDKFQSVKTQKQPPKLLRLAVQGGIGRVEMFPPALALSVAEGLTPKTPSFAESESDELDDLRIGELKKKFPSAFLGKENVAGINVKEAEKLYEKALEGSEKAEKFTPTVENLAKLAGFSPQGRAEELLRLSGSASKLAKAPIKAAIAAPAIAATGEGLGVPKPISDIAALGLSGLLRKKGSPILKPSGMKTKKFEKLEKDVKIYPGKKQEIIDKMQNEVKDISEDILQKNKNVKDIRNTPGFIESIDKGFEEVEKLAKNIEIKIASNNIANDIFNNSLKKPSGVTYSDYEKNFIENLKKLHKEIPKKGRFSISDWIRQYRINNQTLGEIFKSGSSKSENRAKRDALLFYNEMIAKQFEKQLPKSQFTELFKKTNEQFSAKKALEDVDIFLKKVFPEGKMPSFSSIENLFKDKNLQRQLKSLVGEEGYREFSTLMKDVLSSKKGLQHLKESSLSVSSIVKYLVLGKMFSPFYATRAAAEIPKWLRSMNMGRNELRKTRISFKKSLKNKSKEESIESFNNLNKQLD